MRPFKAILGTVAALAMGASALVIAAPPAAACGGYGEAPCPTYVVTFDANGGSCTVASVSGGSGSWANTPTVAQCTRTCYTLNSWTVANLTFAPGQAIQINGNNTLTAQWTGTCSTTASPSPTSPTSPPTTGPGPVDQPNGASNPPNPTVPRRVSANVTVVARATALATQPRYYVFRASTKIKNAPQADKKVNGKYVPIYKVGQVVRLVARVPANTKFDMAIKDAGKWVSVGSGLSDANGRMSMVAFRGSKAVEYAYRFTDANGKKYYVKVNLAGPRKYTGDPYEQLRTS